MLSKVVPFAESLVDRTPLINSKNKLSKAVRFTLLAMIVTPGSCFGVGSCGSYLAAKITEQPTAKAEMKSQNQIRGRINSVIDK